MKKSSKSLQKSDTKSCENCVNKLICPNFGVFGTCSGYNDAGCFEALLGLLFIGNVSTDTIHDKLKFVKDFQSKNHN